MPNRIPFNINWLQGSAQSYGWLKTTALAVFEHGDRGQPPMEPVALGGFAW
jgi:hypothetical protein